MKTIKNIKQVETALLDIAEIDLRISDANKNAQELITRAKAQAEDATRGLNEKRRDLVEQLKGYSDIHKDIFEKGKKSAKFVNGEIGYRKTPDKIEVSADTAELLEKAGFAHCIKIKKEPVKAALKGFTDEQLAKFKTTRIAGQESFYVKASENCVKQNAS